LDNFDRNNIESIYVVLVTEQCYSGTSALLSNQNHKNEFKPILLHKFHFGRPQLLIVRGDIGDLWKRSILKAFSHYL